jgi:hypothetical protein
MFAAAAALAVLVLLISSAQSEAHAQAAPEAVVNQSPYVMYGFVSAGADGVLPSRVRAMIGDVVCGSADISRVDEGSGFYVVTVAAQGLKDGCGGPESLVELLLLSGAVDPGSPAAYALYRPGGAERYDLSTAAPSAAGFFIGELPAGAGQAVLQWTGASAVPIERALASLGRTVDSVYFWDMNRQVLRSFLPGAPRDEQTYTLIDAEDIVIVQVR